MAKRTRDIAAIAQYNAAHYIEFRDAGLVEWRNFTHSTRVAQSWIDAGFTVDEATEWRDGYTHIVGDLPDGAAEWRDKGLTPQEACRAVNRKYPHPQRTR